MLIPGQNKMIRKSGLPSIIRCGSWTKGVTGGGVPKNMTQGQYEYIEHTRSDMESAVGGGSA